jgi:three-Cys-motif partner protein
MLDKMRAFCGSDDWRDAVYSREGMLDFGDEIIAKQDARAILRWFRDRLLSAAGFSVVSNPVPVRNSTNNILYELFFASHSDAARRVIGPMERRFVAEKL